MSYDPRKWYSNLYGETETADENIGSAKEELDSDNTSVEEVECGPYDANIFVDDKPVVVIDDDETSQYDPSSPALERYSSSNNTTYNDARSLSELYSSNSKLLYDHTTAPDLYCSSKPKKDPRKLDTYISTLQKFIRPLSPDYKRKLSYDIICQLANSLLDGTVFEIAKGLKDIQEITEKNLSQQRLSLLTQHRSKRSDLKKRHKSEVSNCKNRSHQITLLEKQHTEEKRKLKEMCEKELLQIDQKIVLEIDQKVSDQQMTLQRAGLPLFFITNNPEDVKLQMYVLDFVMRLSKV